MTLSVRSQATPNPNARKFILSQDVKAQGKVSFSSASDCEHVPLAWALLALPAINQVHFFENVITVTKDGSGDWNSLDKLIVDVMHEEIPRHDIFFADSIQTKKPIDRTQLAKPIQDIEEILDRTIRPGLQADGGDLEVVDFADNILTIRYEGACGSCPSSMYGTLNAIQSILREEYDEQIEVAVV